MYYYFENMGQPNIRAITEMRYRMNCKRIGIWAGIYLLLGFGFLWEYLRGYAYLFTPLIMFGAVVYFVLSPYLHLRKAWKKELQFHNGVMPVNTARFGETIRIENATSARSWEYHQLTQVCSYRYSYCLRFADQSVLLLERENFTKGTFEEFKQFLRYKRPDLNIPE